MGGLGRGEYKYELLCQFTIAIERNRCHLCLRQSQSNFLQGNMHEALLITAQTTKEQAILSKKLLDTLKTGTNYNFILLENIYACNELLA